MVDVMDRGGVLRLPGGKPGGLLHGAERSGVEMRRTPRVGGQECTVDAERRTLAQETVVPLGCAIGSVSFDEMHVEEIGLTSLVGVPRAYPVEQRVVVTLKVVAVETLVETIGWSNQSVSDESRRLIAPAAKHLRQRDGFRGEGIAT